MLIDIWEISQKKNRVQGITGALYCDTQVYLQVLEGSYAAVSRAMRRISEDNRHEDIQLIHGCEIDARRFADWDMKIVNAMSDPGMSERFQRDRILNGGHRYIQARLTELLAE